MAESRVKTARALDKDRQNLALFSAWEIEALAEIIHDQLADDEAGLPLRSMLRRIKRLAGVQMSAISDDRDPTESIRARFDEVAEPDHG